jgi:ribosomal protein L37AE/L43A
MAQTCPNGHGEMRRLNNGNWQCDTCRTTRAGGD